MRTVVAAAGCALVLVASACGSASNTAATGTATNTTKPKVGVILPDTTTSARWEDSDKPLLTSQLSFAGIEPDIQNAQGDEKRFSSLADKMIAEKVNVLMIAPLSSDGGAAVEKKAKAAGIPVIDYDRISLGGSAEYYVSFDNIAVGQLQADGLLQCLGNRSGASVIEIEGASTDNNATQFHDGHEQVLKSAYDSGRLRLIASKSIDGWSPDTAAATFTNLLDGSGGHVDAVLAANDGMAASIEAVLKQRNLTNVPVTGQDATLGGLQAVLRGTQCMTVYKPIDIEAEAASRLAIALATGRQGDADDLATGNTKDPKGNRNVKSVLLGPQSISKADVQGLVAKGVVHTGDLCKGDMAGFCASAGIPVQ
ncbi:sugar ABC transporter substrate-binding protein [Kutzneria sp. CA-103260]|uniref:sugar ABC transporter substrate-binding protein n=1 Tax=Kutzneria sp. CA-103260 TaxID=2802641 RepID=UPI001BAB6BDD|nr:substrate-binding domain-containing protein [Kutzneria sp. CA-103260]QUQ65129.1 sugar ABC transporter periplasmic protein [Kutzneria sp. CA-103260]